MTELIKTGEVLSSVSGNKLRGWYHEVRVKSGSFDDNTNSSFKGRYDFEFDTSYRTQADLSKSFFLVTDRLRYGDGSAIPTTYSNIARCKNHCSALWNNMSVYLNNVQIENINDVPQADTLQKRQDKGEIMNEYSPDYLNGYSGNLSVRAAVDNELYPERESSWHPSCSGMFQKKIPQNVSTRISMVADADYENRAVESEDITKGTAAGTNFRYRCKDVKLFVWMEEGAEGAPAGSTYQMDLKSCEVINHSLLNTAAQRIKLNVKPSTYGLTFAIQDSDVSNSAVYSPTEFRERNNIERSLTYLRMIYAGQQFNQPQIDFTNDGTVLAGYPLVHAMNFYSGDFDLESAGYEKFSSFWDEVIHQWSITKPEDDKSTQLEVDFTSTASANAALIINNNYSKACYIQYDSAGIVTSVSVEEI